MRYYQLVIICLLLLILLFGRFLITPQTIIGTIGGDLFIDNNWPQAKIYSTYPFSNRAELLLNVGSRDGAEEMMPVTIDGELLIGQIIKVFDNYSVARTVFDPDWELSVRVGIQQIDALLEGGATPRLTMVAKNKEFMEGQVVYSASKDFRYGTPLGTVEKIEDSPTAVFREAELSVPYNFNDLREVTVGR
ncbi:MAG: rod shape-determining protein MreC [bacterium]|nr:rod shape-determining protein MreC [bacterium]